MPTFNVCKIAINDFHHLFDDVALSVAASLRDLGYECSMTVNDMRPDAINILIGSIMFNDMLISSQLTQPYIVYQMEILDDHQGHLKNYPKYLDFLSRALSVWDYSPKNFKYLKSKGLKNLAYVPPGYHAVCEKFSWRESPHEFDFLFIGSLSQRRSEFLTSLINKGYRVGAITENNDAFGEMRDQVIANSKIIVNVHCFDDLDILETVRLSYLLTNHAVVISEASDHDPYQGAVGYAPYAELVDYCGKVLEEGENLRQRSSNGYAAMRAIDMTSSIRAALLQIGIV
ncbi:hypothetical protein [Polynucleobacter ibericus]|uniref:hypothetical protein n=1 Tax=Polynucleobacter ibericus TaxID=1819725 RepID=UPI001BFE8F9F|nr:hypothetical protein [Polynucleobacter ibericus]QWE08780.1 hypothetical protein AOC20_00725 [Polynucleobacter ibericus]